MAASIRRSLGILLAAVLLAPLAGCGAEETKSVCIIEQYNPALHEWHGLVYVFGSMDNYDTARNIVEKWQPGSERPLRVVTRKLPMSVHERIKQQIGRSE